MPELKNWEGDRSLGVVVDWEEYGYRDRKREEVRRRGGEEKQVESERKLESESSMNVMDRAGSSLRPEKKERKRAWSDKLDARDEREERRNKKRTKREREKWAKMSPKEREERRELERMIDQVKARKVKRNAEEDA